MDGKKLIPDPNDDPDDDGSVYEPEEHESLWDDSGDSTEEGDQEVEKSEGTLVASDEEIEPCTSLEVPTTVYEDFNNQEFRGLFTVPRRPKKMSCQIPTRTIKKEEACLEEVPRPMEAAEGTMGRKAQSREYFLRFEKGGESFQVGDWVLVNTVDVDEPGENFEATQNDFGLMLLSEIFFDVNNKDRNVRMHGILGYRGADTILGHSYPNTVFLTMHCDEVDAATLLRPVSVCLGYVQTSRHHDNANADKLFFCPFFYENRAAAIVTLPPAFVKISQPSRSTSRWNVQGFAGRICNCGEPDDNEEGEPTSPQRLEPTLGVFLPGSQDYVVPGTCVLVARNSPATDDDRLYDIFLVEYFAKVKKITTSRSYAGCTDAGTFPRL
ncbi:hypothetical protein BDK51DRAFT_48643 [Blyttiomyces helicus]|uniref:BAH domain-containing protein n=1 Tax=Blyttiomyces helicus TaxID=388810 RepID=A0A4P9W1S5_9FUNG|nr:hypothetical protein BDK51DRAFT_48643 [Blyttiomyces helicus]|eukprot:RKO84026.1 hypothetical protein BDK51DRAFT_48643 [Blyttiomyces helicus]